ncbi:Transmembrane_domain-containing protein [Hexamita inflata]|uniref:Transmembrane_domain-containing protein n=1 Tax=Hexamita inflata TaxID=28002 RepID=A0ABP1M0Z9_9EUKA
MSQKLASAKGCLKKCHQTVRNFFTPNSVFPDGASRIISVDVARGLCLFFVTLIHEVNYFVDIDKVMKLKMPKALAVYIVGAPAMIFAQWRSFLVLISGLTYGYLSASPTSIKSMSVQLIKKEIASGILLPVFFALNLIYLYFDTVSRQTRAYGIDGSGTQIRNPFAEPWFMWARPESCTCLFYGMSYIFLHGVTYVVQIPMLFLKKMKEHHKSYTTAGIWLALAMVVCFTSNSVQNSIFNHYKDLGYLTTFTECPVNALPGNIFRASSKDTLRHLWYAFLSGEHTFVFPLWTNICLGCMIGLCLQGVMLHKKQLTVNQWIKWRKIYLTIFGFSFAIPGIMLGIQTGITNHDVKVGRRTEYQTLAKAMSSEYACLMPEMLMQDTIIQFFVLFILFLIFDGTTKEKAIKRTNDSLYLRRFSTGSLTVYVWSMTLGNIVRGLTKNYDPADIGQIWGLIILGFVLQVFLMIALDAADWVLTPDWVLSLVPKVMQGRFKKGTFANNHLRVRPINVFEKIKPEQPTEQAVSDPIIAKEEQDVQLNVLQKSDGLLTVSQE